jgi:hypothetical protein
MRFQWFTEVTALCLSKRALILSHKLVPRIYISYEHHSFRTEPAGRVTPFPSMIDNNRFLSHSIHSAKRTGRVSIGHVNYILIFVWILKFFILSSVKSAVSYRLPPSLDGTGPAVYFSGSKVVFASPDLAFL